MGTPQSSNYYATNHQGASHFCARPRRPRPRQALPRPPYTNVPEIEIPPAGLTCLLRKRPGLQSVTTARHPHHVSTLIVTYNVSCDPHPPIRPRRRLHGPRRSTSRPPPHTQVPRVLSFLLYGFSSSHTITMGFYFGFPNSACESIHRRGSSSKCPSGRP